MKNDYKIIGDKVIININRRIGPAVSAIISIEDLDKVKSFPGTWCAKWNPKVKGFYARGSYQSKDQRIQIYLHRFITDAPPGMHVDHINHNTVDCSRENLRIVTASENHQNRKGATSISKCGIRGVFWHKRSSKWCVSLQINGEQKHIGLYSDLSEAESASINARHKYMPYSREGITAHL